VAASQEQKVDYLLKKIGYVASKTGIAEDSSLSGTKKAPFGEAIPSPLVVPATNIWSDSSLIPATPPGSTGATVQVYLTGTSGHRMTADSTISGNRTFIAYSTYNNSSTAILGDWIDTSFGADYIIKVYKGDPNSGGVQLSAAGSGSNDTWFFDYSSGVLNFNGTSVPSGVTSSNIYIVGYRYVGGKGAQPVAGFSTFSSLNVSGIATVGGLLDANGGIRANNIIQENLSNNRVVIVGSGQNLEDSANLTFDGTLLTVAGVATVGNVKIDANEIHTTSGNLTIDSAGGTVTVDDDLRVVGLLTAANAYIVGNLTVEGTTTTLNTNLTEVDKLEVGANNTTVGAAITQSGTGDILNLYDGSTEVFSVQDGGRIVATATNNVIPFLYANYSDLPSASTYHGAFAHVHSTGSAYYAHANAWYELVRRESTGVVGTGTDRYNIGFIDATNLDVSGVSTFAGLTDFNGNIDVAGISTFANTLNANGRIVGIQTNNVIPFYYDNVSDFPSAATYHGAVAHAHNTGRLYFAHAGWKELVNKEADGTIGTGSESYHVGVITATTFKGNGDFVDIDVDGQTELDDLNVAGVSTFIGAVTFNGDLDLQDNDKILLGTGDDLQLYHDGSHSYIKDAGTGNLVVQSNRIDIQNAAGSAEMARFQDNGAVTLSFNGSTKFQTTATGIDVTGNTETDDLTVTGTAYLNGTVSAASSTGAAGQVLQSTGVGVTWATTPATRTSQTFTAAEDQTTFSFNYTVGLLDVFYNGVKLASTEFTANNGTSVVLGDVAYAGDIVEFISYNTITAGSGGGGASSLNQLSDVSIVGSAVIGETLTHNGTSFVNDFTTSQTTTSTSQFALLSLDLSVYRSVEYQIQVVEGSKYHTTKILAIHNGTAAVSNEYGTLNIGASTATFDVDINGSNLRLLATPASSNSTVFKVKFTAIKV
tara:strand:+ start:963 stop:3758 length:2796 start_codon:yes stop_codon:yes gene_type:complete